MSNNIETSTCPKCGIRWPCISEQAVVLDKVGICYGCFVGEVVAQRDYRVKEADYTIDDCPACVGSLTNPREDCKTCDGNGWVVGDLDADDTLTLIAKT